MQVRFQYENTDGAGFIEKPHEWSTGEASDVIKKFRHALQA